MTLANLRRRNPAKQALVDRASPPAWNDGVIAIIAGLSLTYGVSAAATTYVVNTTGDPGPMGTQSLRQAVVTANGSPGNTVQFDASLTGSTITLAGSYITTTQPMTISGPGADKLTISGNDASRIFLVEGGGVFTISGLTLTHGRTDPPLSGAAIAAFNTSVSVQNCVISENSSVNGAGILVQSGDLTIANSLISGNSAGYSGGAIFARCNAGCGNLSISQSTISRNYAGQFGAGIYAYKLHGISISQSTIDGNRNFAPTGQAGGGLFMYATQTVPVISNSTISGNYSYSRGGGIYADTANFLFTTIADNSTHANDSNGLLARSGGSITLQDSLLANNFSSNSAVDLTGGVTANFSLIRNAGAATVGGTNKLIGLDPQLSPLADHGGTTLTMLPAAASPAVESGEASLPPTLDQRGLPRPVGAHADMGAAELQTVEDVVFRTHFGDGFQSPLYKGLVINEVDYDQPGTDDSEFIEIFNGSGQPVNLAGLALVLVNGSNSSEYLRINLGTSILAAGQYLVVHSANVIAPQGAVSLLFPGNSDQIQNGGPDGIALVDATFSRLLDSLSYEGSIVAAQIAGFPGPVNLVEGTPLDGAVADSGAVAGSLARLPNGRDRNDANTDWSFAPTPTPGAVNQ